jgi:hypothetical protein
MQKVELFENALQILFGQILHQVSAPRNARVRVHGGYENGPDQTTR